MTLQDIANTPEVQAAIAWWASKINSGEFDNGDAFCNAFFQLLKVENKTSADQRAEFADVLRGVIATLELHDPRWAYFAGGRDLERRWTEFGITLGCDYHPDAILSRACEAAGIGTEIGVFPAKTTMRVKPGLVEVSCGYGAPYVTIYPAGEP